MEGFIFRPLTDDLKYTLNGSYPLRTEFAEVFCGVNSKAQGFARGVQPTVGVASMVEKDTCRHLRMSKTTSRCRRNNSSVGCTRQQEMVGVRKKFVWQA